MKYFYTLLTLLAAVKMQAQLKITPGTQVINNGSIAIEGNGLVNNGSFLNNNGANVVFKGTGNHAVSGSGTTIFYGLELNKASDNISLQQNIKVAGPLKFTKGSLDLASSSLQLLYPGGLLQNETEQNRIFSTGNGYVFIEQSLNAPAQSNPGNLGFIITSSNNLGNTVIYRGHDRQTKANGNQSIKRHYSIVPATNTSISASITFSYLDAELDGQPESAQQLHQKTGTANWQEVGVSATNTQQNTISANNVSALDKYTLFPGNALPLRLLAFSARCKDQGAVLQWITANEVQTKQFVIETSNNGLTWQPMNTVSAQGNTLEHTYTTNVMNGGSFFRLRMEDIDGKYQYSPVKMIDCSTSPTIVAGPNPTKGTVTISLTADASKMLVIEVLDMRGRTLFTKTWQVNQGLNSLVIDLARYPSSTYLVAVKDGRANEVFKIVKE